MPRRAHTPGQLEPIERASRDEIESLQLQRLQWSVRHAYENVRQYRTKCLASSVHPDDLKALADLARFPFTTKTEYQVSEAMRLMKEKPSDRLMKEPTPPMWGKRKPPPQ